ncbi:MAG: endopeptidase La [Bacteroidales bacterium]|jgi:ATP-dependent Lon protease|nr:endopeptidase La [Bacteroidales bacterium]
MIDFLDNMNTPAGVEVNIMPVVGEAASMKVDTSQLPPALPVLPLRNAVIFPGTVFPVTVGREKSIKLVSDVESGTGWLVAIPQADISVEEPTEADLCSHGTVCKLIKMLEMPDGSVTAILQGSQLAALESVISYDPYMMARVTYLEESVPTGIDERELRVLAESLKEKAAMVVKSSSFAPKEAIGALRSIENFHFLVNFIATTIEVENFQERTALLSITDIHERGMSLLRVLDAQTQLLQIKQEINQKVKTDIDQQQREYYLNNQLRTIQEELGMDEGEEFEKMRRRADEKKWSKEVRAIFDKEMARLEKYNPTSPDYSIQFAYIQFMLDLPWGEMSDDNLDLAHAQEVLDQDHFGLDQVKDRIIEYLAVLKLKGNMKSPILCLWGPPGVGKTSLGKSIARALGRKYIRISLGGMHDEAEIRGHRKTYVGALPGRILSGIQRAGTSNPVIVLDEIDKLASDFKGDPSSALLEALDPEQNSTFHDNYLDIDYDLSNVLFITTANGIGTIQPALKDRMEMINVSGYLAEEKLQIAHQYLVPKQLTEHGLRADELSISDEALKEIVDKYTHESGVRGLEKQIAKIARVTAKKMAMEQEFPRTIGPEHLREYLGLPTAFHDDVAGNEGVGVVTGLAWTEMGGEVLFVESQVSDGKGNLSMTGNLGDVMKESAQIAWQYIKAHPELAGITTEEFMKKDIHLHVPEGATPKDGPSAGITMVSSMVSALRGQAPKKGIAMTGEMTLRGRVLPVGGIKEKILAAKRAGVHTIVISEENRKDVEDIKEIYIKGLIFVYVKTIADVINFIF